MTPSDLPERTPVRTNGMPLLELRGIVKRFGAMTAVDHVDLDVRAGEIHALLGENGAGKSTLMNCLFGLQRPDEGEIVLEGQTVSVTSPRRAQELGIGMVHQHFKLVPNLTVAENVFLGHEPSSGPFLRRREAETEVRELSERYGLDVDPTERVRALSVGAQQRVEILRALARRARVLVLDEPTAVLTPAETERFFEVIRGFAAQGLAVVLISHHLDEVRSVADVVTVLQRGRRVANTAISDVTNRQLAELIVGEERETVSEVAFGTPGDVRLRVSDLVVRNQRTVEVVHEVSFDVRSGEIVGLLGIAGNGQSELVEAVTGLRAPAGGSVTMQDLDVTGAHPAELRAAGMASIPEDRNGRGLALYWSVANNITVGYLSGPEVGGRTISRDSTTRLARRLMTEYDVRAATPAQLARRLSGGNAQKAVLARELSRDPQVVVCSEPTRGLDIAAAAFVSARLLEQRDRGSAILLVSSEIDEVVRIADRVLVISAGRITAEFSGRRPSEAEVGRAMLGGRDDTN